MRRFYADLHVHLGRAGGRPVKISASAQLTVAAVLDHCRRHKGIDIVGIIDAATPGALQELGDLAAAGELTPLAGGGLDAGGVVVLPGAEVEVWFAGAEGRGRGGAVHLLVYLPGLAELAEFAAWQVGRAGVRNPWLSTQRHRVGAAAVAEQARQLGGVVVPAHAFTPYKSVLAAADRLADVLPPELWSAAPAVELGLSADTELATAWDELAAFAFLANSDAHSLGTIAREYNELELAAPSFAEWLLALRGEGGRRITANYGLDPRLGKYHRSYCLDCAAPLGGEPPLLACPHRPRHRIVIGVLDRLIQARGAATGGVQPPGRPRPPYVHQVPLSFIPGVGPRVLDRLVAAFGSEMAVLHRAGAAQLAEVVGEKLAARIVAARAGRLRIDAGAGGRYGRVLPEGAGS